MNSTSLILPALNIDRTWPWGVEVTRKLFGIRIYSSNRAAKRRGRRAPSLHVLAEGSENLQLFPYVLFMLFVCRSLSCYSQ